MRANHCRQHLDEWNAENPWSVFADAGAFEEQPQQSVEKKNREA